MKPSPADAQWLARHGRAALPRPFLKWAGGKTQLLRRIEQQLPRRFNTYFEPFAGAGALFFYLHREKRLGHAHLSDINPHLMGVWERVRDDVEGVIAALKGHRNERDWYYEVRGWDPQGLSPAERAARIIYLNRTCYNGLYRENRSGHFNVPFGRYVRPRICDEENLRAVSAALQGQALSCRGFEEVADDAKKGDFVYFDPPYQPRSRTSSFTSYTKHGFTEVEQRALREVIDRLHRRGAYVMLSNSDTDFIADLYDAGHLTGYVVMARRSINSVTEARGHIQEFIFTSYR